MRLKFAVMAPLVAGLTAAVGCAGQSDEPRATTVVSPPAAPEIDNTPGSTCAGWTSLKNSLQGVTQLPHGWTYQSALIDIQISARSAQLATLLDIFASKIQSAPPEVAAAAHNFIEAQAAETTKLTEHTFTASDQAAIDDARRALDSACGIP
jgi:hypothetical protein